MKRLLAQLGMILLGSVVVAHGAERTATKPKAKTGGPSMEQLLEKGFQGSVIQKSEQGAPAGGVQRPRKARGKAKPAGETHLRVVLDVGEDGTVDVVSVTELPGAAPLNSAPRGDVIYEFTDGDKPIVAEALPGDPFEAHAFGDPKGHTFVKMPRATIVTTIPKRGKKSALDGLGFRLYRLEKGAQRMDKVNKFELEKQKKSGKLRTLASLPANKLGPALRAGSSLDAKSVVGPNTAPEKSVVGPNTAPEKP